MALVVPPEIDLIPSTLAVTIELFVIPNETPFEFERTTVPVVFAVCVPAAMMFTPSPAPPPDGTENTIEPSEYPMLATPAPTKLNVLASNVELEDCPVVFDTAYRPSVWTDCAPSATESNTSPPEYPTLIAPTPRMVTDLASNVELEDCPVV